MAATLHEMPHRPRLLFAYADSAYAACSARRFRRLGWEVHMVASAAEVQRLVAAYAPDVLVLDLDLPDESGWLTSAKVAVSHPDQRIILLGSDRPEARERLQAVGAAALVLRTEPLEALVSAVYGRNLARAV